MKSNCELSNAKMVLISFVLAITMVLTGCSGGTKDAKSTFPDKSITMIVPYGAGGGTDQVARVMKNIMERDLKLKVTVVNKVGGGGSIGFSELAKSPADGYSIILGASNLSIYQITGVANMTYKDYAPIAAVNYDAPALMVRKDSPWKNFEDFAKDAKQRKIMVGTGSPGGIWHLGAIDLQKALGATFTIVASSSGSAPTTTTLLGGHVEAIISPPNESTSQVKSGDFRVLAVFAKDRNPIAPDAPTLNELGHKIDIRSQRAFYTVKGTPDEIVNKLADIFKKVHDSKEFQDYAKQTGSNTIYLGPKELVSYLEKEMKDYGELVRNAGLAK